MLQEVRQSLATLLKQYEDTRNQASAILGNLQGLVSAREAQSLVLADAEPLRKGLEEVQAKLSEGAGIGGLVSAFQKNGLGDVVASWISNNTNLPISAEQIQSVLGQGPLQDLASKMGLSTGDVASTLSERLPGLVDQLTPNGELPSGDLMSQGLGMLKGFMKS